MKKQLNDELTRIIERENVITFKRKNEGKASVKSSKEEDDDLESAKSHPSEDPSFSKPSKKSIPLPQLSRQKKRLILRNILPETKAQSGSNYHDREVRQQDNLMLKNMNNHLTNENLKLKTKNMNLEKEVVRLIKVIQEDPQKNKLMSSKDIKMRTNDSTSLKIALRNLQKEVEEVKRENGKIKTSIKFTTISELEIERDSIFEETARLREMVEEERNRIMFLRANQHGISAMEQKLILLQEKNHYLTKEIHDLKTKIKSDGKEKVSSKFIDSEKNLNKMLFNSRRLLKEKDRELDQLKAELKKQPLRVESTKVLEVSPGLENSRVREVKSELASKMERTDRLKGGVKDKRLMSKSAQKYRSAASNQEKTGECQLCKKLKEENKTLSSQIDKFRMDLDQVKGEKLPIGQLSKKPIAIPQKEQIERVQRFLCHRFKAHHLTLDEASYHLINFEGKAEDSGKDISIAEILQIVMAEPFSILSDRYIETFIVYICYNELIGSPHDAECLIQEGKHLSREEVQGNFRTLIGDYQLINQSKEEEMFIQIAELVTQYQQHILKALNDKRNSESTINEQDFYQFFKEIELERDYIDFMVSQIILESLDLDHLNIYNLFEIFYMPPQPDTQAAQAAHPQKKKFNMIQTVVKEEDEEYEESKSFLDSRHKSESRNEQEQENYEEEDGEEGYTEGVEEKPIQSTSQIEQYEQLFEEEKMENPAEQEKANQEEKPGEPQHYNIENVEEEYVEDYEA